MSEWAGTEHIEARWVSSQPLPPVGVVKAYLDDAEAVVRFEFPDVADRIESNDLALSSVRMVVCQMVLRVLRNPDNVRSKQSGIGSYMDGTTYNGDAELWLTDDERAMLSGSSRRQRAFTIDTTPAHSPANNLEGAWVNGPLGSEPGL